MSSTVCIAEAEITTIPVIAKSRMAVSDVQRVGALYDLRELKMSFCAESTESAAITGYL